MANARLQTIYFEAGRLFNQRGYANTKMNEIAKAAGIAVGTMYSSFSGKDAVLSFVIRATLDKEYLNSDLSLPIKPTDPATLLALLKDVLDDGFSTVMQITDEQGNICKSFSALMEELFALFADYLLAFNNIESNAGVLEELSEEFLPRRDAYYDELANCLEKYARAGQIRSLTNIPAHVVYLTETLAWWALNVNLYFPHAPIPRDVAKETCIGIIQRAYQC